MSEPGETETRLSVEPGYGTAAGSYQVGIESEKRGRKKSYRYNRAAANTLCQRMKLMDIS